MGVFMRMKVQPRELEMPLTIPRSPPYPRSPGRDCADQCLWNGKLSTGTSRNHPLGNCIDLGLWNPQNSWASNSRDRVSDECAAGLYISQLSDRARGHHISPVHWRQEHPTTPGSFSYPAQHSTDLQPA